MSSANVDRMKRLPSLYVIYASIRIKWSIVITAHSLEGQAMKVVIQRGPYAHSNTYTIPQGLLKSSSGHFNRLKNFKENAEKKVELTDCEPAIFELFLQFIYHGTYHDSDNIKDHSKVRDSAKVWVFTDYLDAPELKRVAIQKLSDLYLRTVRGTRPGSGFGPETIRYCCENSKADSSLYQLYVGVAALYWRYKDIIHYNDANQHLWKAVWKDYPDFQNDMLRQMTLLPEDWSEKHIVSLRMRVNDTEAAVKTV